MQVGLPFTAAASAKALLQRGNVVPVRLRSRASRSCATCPPEVPDPDVLDEAVELDPVVIHDGHDVVELVGTAEHGRFPDLAFLNFAVAQHHVGARRALVQPRGEPHADGQRQSLAQRSGGGFERRQEAHIRMALVNRTELAQRVELVLGTIAAFRHHRVQDRAAVPFGKNEAVAIRPLGVGGIVPHHVEEQRDDDFGAESDPPGMAGFRLGDHLDHLAPHLLGNGRKLGRVAGGSACLL